MLLALGPAVSVTGEGDCPSATDVDARVRALLPEREGVPDRATLELVGPALQIALFSPDGARIGERRLDRSGTCAELAGAAAVVIASWASSGHPEFLAALPTPVLAVVRATTPPSATTWRWEVGAGLGATVSNGAVPALALSATVGKTGRRTALRLALMGSGWQDERLGTGQAQWRRWPLALGPQFRLVDRMVVVEATGQAAMALAQVRGRGFDTTRDHLAVRFGANAGLAVALRRTGWRPWLGLNVFFWPLDENPEGDGAVTTLPHWDVALVVGAALGR